LSNTLNKQVSYRITTLQFDFT